MDRLVDNENTPLRLIVAGPGGTGKSHIYEALRQFYAFIDRMQELAFTAPTGIAASNIGGSTTASFLSLRTQYQNLINPNSQSRKKLVNRLQGIRTLIIDEFFFMGCEDFDRVSRHLNVALGASDDPFVGLDLVLSGDQFQLTTPKSKSLYDREFAAFARGESSLQSQNQEVQKGLQGFKHYRTITECVMLDEIVRQRNPRFAALLGRLRWGMCTVDGDDNDLEYLEGFRALDCSLHDITIWVTDRESAAPLVTYTNSVRNAHNWNMTKAFAAATTQPFNIFYAEDSVGKGSSRVLLSGQNAIDAWDTEIKHNAHDLSGRLALAAGMPVIVVDNLAVEMGLSNGSLGTLITVNYFTRDGRKYAVSADVDVPKYTSPDPHAIHPHRVTIPTITDTITYYSSGSCKSYSVRRQQLPLIGGFAFTVHNSQSRSLRSAYLHLESCQNTAATYVLLSRIKCGDEGPTGMRILGDVLEKKISTHASQEARSEDLRLQQMALGTLQRAKIKLNWYIASTDDDELNDL